MRTFSESMFKDVVASPNRAGSIYAELSRRVRAAGLLSRRPGYYTAKISATVALLLAGWTAFIMIGDTWWQLGTAAFLAVMFTQAAFIGHDAGHRQIFRTRRAAYLAGLLLGNLGVGLSYGWWVDKHNRHHAHPNELDSDPDIEAGALVFTDQQTGPRRGLGRWLSRSQAYLFFPMLLLEGLNLHAASGRALIGRTGVSGRTRAVEAILLLAHLGGYLAVVFAVLSPLHAVAFIALHQGLFGLYLGMSFAPNHKGMPVLTRDERLDYLYRQVLTSRNIRGGRFTDLVLGGLNYQIEHHLFPNMPRPNLRRAQALVRDFCTQHGIAYTQTSVVRSYALVLRHLHAVGAPPRGTRTAS